MKNQYFLFILLLILINLNTLSAQATISGQITCLEGSDVADQEVQLTGSAIGDMTTMTDASGNYSFTNLPEGENYTLTVEKGGNAPSGVSTYDMVLIMQHVLGIQFLPSPFHILAADVNGSGTLTTLDLIVLRKVILFIETSFPVPTWQFATSDYDANGAGSVGGASMANLQGDEAVDFVMVKTGDVSGSAICQ